MKARLKIVPELPGYAFWDTDVKKLDFSGNKDLIISRMFETAGFDDVLDIVSYYGLNECSRVLKANKYLSKDGMYLAHVILGIPLKTFSSYTLHQHD